MTSPSAAGPRRPWEKAAFWIYALVLLRTQGRAPAELRLMYLADGVTLTNYA